MWGENKKQETPPPPTRPLTSGAATGTATATAIAERPAPAEPEETIMSINTVEANRPAVTASGGMARVGPSLHIKGEITGNEDLELHGTVEGTVNLEERKLTVGPTAKVSADLAAREIIIYGSVKGNLRARDRIEIKKDGSVIGDLSTARIMIEDGAYFKGSIEITREGETDKARTARVG